MSRPTKKQIVAQEALASFEAALAALPDPRRKQGQRYPLESVVVIALMATVCGCDDGESMQRWGECNEEWLSSFLELPHGVPTQDVFLSVFAAVDPAAFSRVFISWAKILIARLDRETAGTHIALDGKTSRRSFGRDENGEKTAALHTVSAWMSDVGLVLGQQKTADKSNEITAIPELLRLLDIRGATITIDAMGCQTKIASTILGGGANYLLAVKDNQPTLHDDIKTAFDEALSKEPRPLDQPVLPLQSHTSVNDGHGRIEERTVHVCPDVSWMTTAADWKGLSFIALVESKRTELSTNKVSTERRYYIGSEAHPDAAKVGHTIRRHWGIENQLHWVLDMAFREDEARHRAGNCAANLTTLRHFAVNLLKLDKTEKLGVANKRKIAGWNRDYLLHVLSGALA
jgi:predicted transposase YbfD/YdcC